MQPSGRKHWQGKQNMGRKTQGKSEAITSFSSPGFTASAGRTAGSAASRLSAGSGPGRGGKTGSAIMGQADPSRERKAGGGDCDEKCTKHVPTAISSNCEISHCTARFYATILDMKKEAVFLPPPPRSVLLGRNKACRT